MTPRRFGTQHLPHDVRRLMERAGDARVYRYCGRLYGRTPTVTRVTRPKGKP